MHKRNMIAALCLVGLAPAAGAHHSFAMFDDTGTIELKGQISKVEWRNPHTWTHIVVGEGEAAVEWAIEGRSPNVLARRGWSRDTLENGDKVTLRVHPLKDGRPGGAMVEVTFEDGTVLNADTPEAVDTDEERALRGKGG